MNNTDLQKGNYELWQKRANELDVITDTFDDIYKRLLENDIIYQRLPMDSLMLDVGCGSGYGTQVYAQRAKHIVGLDYSENMINKANATIQDKKNITFLHGNILDFNYSNKFDVVICQRALINIMNKDEQYKAIENIHTLLNPGGTFFMFEAFNTPRTNINTLRIKYGLPELPKLDFNLNFNEEELEEFLKFKFNIIEKVNTGFYDLINKLIYPIVAENKNLKYEHIVNRIAYELTLENPEISNVFKQYSRATLYVLRKRE